MSESSRPAGVSIGRFLRFDRSAAMNADFAAVLAAIDRVHGVSDALPEIPLVNAGATIGAEPQRSDAWFSYRLTSESDIVPDQVAARIGVAHRRLKTLHEIGHFLDATGLPGRGFSSAGSPELDGWRTAVANSRAYRALAHLGRQTTPGQARVNAALLLEELWARCYSQFIALRSGDSILISQVEALRFGMVGGVQYPLQWAGDDFGQVDAAIATLFVRLRWMT